MGQMARGRSGEPTQQRCYAMVKHLRRLHAQVGGYTVGFKGFRFATVHGAGTRKCLHAPTHRQRSSDEKNL